MRNSYVKMRKDGKIRDAIDGTLKNAEHWLATVNTTMAQVKERVSQEKNCAHTMNGKWKREENDENQNLHETNMILTENLLNSVEL